ncbi:MAG: cytosolic non-specific dipeptidase [Chlamydiales bacterium]|jgi:acetylornithine deacetylase/succinyl-diaminopimelate desuccinylase-like protein|nr:cytosolic non-specific dipeptidase [Chlamydiales bacterium]
MSNGKEEIAFFTAWFEEHREEIFKDFFTFLRFKTISSEPAYQDQMLACASWLTEEFKKLQFFVELWQIEGGHPILFAASPKDPKKPTVLIYNHYDVQPVDPLEGWLSPPFEPTIRDEKVFARGAQDNKGQCFYGLQAVKALLARGELPVNIKWIIEGEEEVGSDSLNALLAEKSEQCLADHLLIVDLGIPGADTPAITLGTRGIITMTVEVETANSDLHSGSNGGIAPNPIHHLVSILSSLHDSSGRVTVDEFYRDCLPLSEEEKKRLSLDFDEVEYEKMFQVKPCGGEKGFSPLERAWVRPTLEINGIQGGYAGEGFKTVLPHRASAKISCRLVAEQQKEHIAAKVKDWIESQSSDAGKVTVTLHGQGGDPMKTEAGHPLIDRLKSAYEEVFQKPCRFILEGGSIPIAAKLTQSCRGKAALIGLGLTEDNIHAPNEHFSMQRIEQGFLIIARALQLLSN